MVVRIISFHSFLIGLFLLGLLSPQKCKVKRWIRQSMQLKASTITKKQTLWVIEKIKVLKEIDFKRSHFAVFFVVVFLAREEKIFLKFRKKKPSSHACLNDFMVCLSNRSFEYCINNITLRKNKQQKLYFNSFKTVLNLERKKNK
jgi:hypothetical protein